MPKKKKVKISSSKFKNNNNNNGNNHFTKQPLTIGQKLADWITLFGGSWTFIILFGLFLFIWIMINTVWIINRTVWDPYPFILLNLALSCLAAIQAPVILMSQNREMDRDRIRAERDYAINRKAEREIEDIQRDLEQIKKLIIKHGK